MEQEIAACLQATLSPDPNARVGAELRLAELQGQGQAGLSLAKLAITQEADIYLRQMTGVALRRYVTERWSLHFSTFKGSPPSLEIKGKIRQIVFHGLSDPQRKIRLACAYVLSEIAHADWPDEYPSLMHDLLQLLSSGSADSVHGAMRVLTEFVRNDLSEDQLIPISRDMLPQMLNILGDSELHPPATRARCVSVFRQCLTTLYMVKEQHPEAVRQAVNDILPIWLNAFAQLLNVNVATELQSGSQQATEGLSIRNEVFRTLSAAFTAFPKAILPALPSFISMSAQHLAHLFPIFRANYLFADSPGAGPIEEGVEDVSADIPKLASGIMDFTAQTTRKSAVKSSFVTDDERATAELSQFVVSAIGFAQMTSDDEETWANDPNAFVANEEEDTESYSLRIASCDLLSILLDRYPHPTVAALWLAIQRQIAESDQLRGQGADDWWKGYEAILTVVGGVADDLTDLLTTEASGTAVKEFNLEIIFNGIVLQNIGATDVPFLQGRAFVFASQYAKALPEHLASQFLDGAIKVLEEPSTGVPVKVSAVRTIKNFARHLAPSLTAPLASRILKDLGPLISQTSEDTLVLLLEAIQAIVVGNEDHVDPDTVAAVVAAALEQWAQSSRDPILVSVISDLFEALASSPSPPIYHAVMRSSLPVLMQAIATALTEDSVQPSPVAEGGVELVAAVLRGKQSPQGLGVVQEIAPVLFAVLEKTEDRGILQGGVEVLSLLVRKTCDELLCWRDASGASGLDKLLAVVARLLAPSESESGGLFVGDLIVSLLRKAGQQVFPVLPELLKALVFRLVTARTASFSQSLIVPFAYLIHTQFDTTLSLLESLQIPADVDPSCPTAIDVLLRSWADNAETFQGFWSMRVSTLALADLYRSGRPSIQNVLVKGDLVVDPASANGKPSVPRPLPPRTQNEEAQVVLGHHTVIKTRSRAKATPDKFTSIPFPQKAVKIILRDLHTAVEQNASGGGTDDVADSEDGDEDWEDDDPADLVARTEEYGFLSDMLGEDMGDLKDEEDDEELKQDPIYTMDLADHLVNFFREASAAQPAYFEQSCASLMLEEGEMMKKVLKK